MNHALGLIAGLTLSAATLAGCAGGGPPATGVRADASSSAGLPESAVTARTGYARKPPTTCAFLDRRPDLLAALSLSGTQPSMKRTLKGRSAACDWQKKASSTPRLITDIFVLASTTRQDSFARAQRAYRGSYQDRPCPSPAVGQPHPAGLTWEEGCLEVYPNEALQLHVRRGNVVVMVVVQRTVHYR